MADTVNTDLSRANDNVASSPSKVNDLAYAIQSRKAHIAAISGEVRTLESELIMICGVKDEGVQKFDTEQFEISTTGKLTRTIKDLATLKSLAPNVVRIKEELDLRMYKKLAVDNPMLFGKVVGTIETKVAKPSVAIKQREVK